MSEYNEGERQALAKESQEKFVDLVEGDIDRGDPVKAIMEDGEMILTFFGWFPTHGITPGGMIICSREGDKLLDSRATRRIRAKNVEKIIPLQERPDNQ